MCLGNEVGNFAQYSTADNFRFRRQPATLIICKQQSPCAQLLSQDSILFAQLLNGMLLLLIHPPGDGDDDEPKWIRMFGIFAAHYLLTLGEGTKCAYAPVASIRSNFWTQRRRRDLFEGQREMVLSLPSD